MTRKISTVITGGAARPDAIATAMNGAVQGVATNTARVPVKKLPQCPWRDARVSPMPVRAPPTRYTPDRFSPTANSNHAIAMTKIGEAN